MLKRIMIGTLLAFLTPSCAKPTIKAVEPVEVKEVTNFIITIHHCGYFISDFVASTRLFENACIAAKFEDIQMFADDINEDTTMFYIAGAHGYASMYINHKIKSAALEFFCSDDVYSYEAFVAAFFAEFNAITEEDVFELFNE